MRIWKVVILLSVLILSACKDSPNSFGEEFIPNGDRYSFNQVDSAAVKDSTYFNESWPEAKAASQAFLLGKNDGYESTALLKFPLTSPDSIKTMLLNGQITIDQSWVEMVSYTYFGKNDAPFDFTVHKLTSAINYTKVTDSSFKKITIDPADITVGTKSYSGDSLTRFELNPEVVKSWILLQTADSNKYARNYGIMLKPTENTNKVLAYLSHENTLGTAAQLHFVFSKTGSYSYKDTLMAFPTLDTYCATSPAPKETEKYMTVAGTITYKNKLVFKLPPLPTNAVMNKAELVLYIDPDKCTFAQPGKKSYGEMGTIVNVGNATNASGVELDTTNVSYAVRLSDKNKNKYLGDITAFAQKWINKGKNYGLIISLSNEEYDPSVLVFYGSKYPDVSLRPRLTITYSLRNKE